MNSLHSLKPINKYIWAGRYGSNHLMDKDGGLPAHIGYEVPHNGRRLTWRYDPNTPNCYDCEAWLREQ